MVLLAVALGLLAFTSRSISTDRDFISYWAGARLLATHGNPYDAASVLKLENAAGNTYTRPLVMRNTPVTMFLMAPLGWFKVSTAALLWEVVLIGAALGSIRLLQPFCAGPIPLVLYFFAPVVDCVLAGQSTLFVLLGVCLFMNLRSGKPFAAGAALVLALLKPHLLVLFWPLLLLEVLRTRQWKLILGGLCGVAAASAIATALDFHIWTQYVTSVRAEHIENQFFPNISVGLRILINPHAFWPQLLPSAIGMVLALLFWVRTRRSWEWPRQGAMVLAGSSMVSPYCFLLDQVLFLPAILYGYPRASAVMRWIFIAVNAAAFFLMLRYPSMNSTTTSWVAPAMLLWCYFIYWRQIADQKADKAMLKEQISAATS